MTRPMMQIELVGGPADGFTTRIPTEQDEIKVHVTSVSILLHTPQSPQNSSEFRLYCRRGSLLDSLHYTAGTKNIPFDYDKDYQP